jgi:hypothetical protein
LLEIQAKGLHLNQIKRKADKYVNRQERLLPVLQALKAQGKKLFIATNHDF